MKKENLYVNYIHLLKNEYREVYDRIDIYIASHGLIIDDTSEIMEDVLDLLLTAQENKTPIEKIIGNDFGQFCDQIIESHKESIIERFLSYFQWFRYIALIFGILELFALIFDYLDGVKNSWNVSVDIGESCLYIIIPFLVASIFNMIRKKLVVKKWYNSKLDTILVILLVIVSMGCCYILSDYILNLISIPRFIFIPFTFLFFIFMTIRKRKQKRKENHISFENIAYNKMIEVYRNQYEKYVNQCQKKNKESEDVKKWYEKKYKKEILGQRVTDILLILVILGIIIFVAMDNEVFDTFVFIIIITVIEIPIFRFTHKGYHVKKKIYEDTKLKDANIYNDELFKEE